MRIINAKVPAAVALLLTALPAQAAALAAAPAAPPPAPAFQSAPTVPGLAVADLNAVMVQSKAWRAAREERAKTYKATIDAAEARRKQLSADLQVLIDKFNKDRAAPKPDQAMLQRAAQAIQQLQQSGNAEIQTLLRPVALSETYAAEQINVSLMRAVEAAMAKQNISFLGEMRSLILGKAGYNLNPAIIAELDAILPAVQVVPPADWQPRAAQQAKSQG